MWFSRTSLALFGTTLVLAACQPELNPLPPAPTPVVWQVEITPALRWLGPVFKQCTAEQPGINLVLSEYSAAYPESGSVDFSFQWGERKAPAGFTAVMAREELAVIVHPSNPNGTLQMDDLRGLYSAQADRWKGPSSACPSCTAGFDGPVQSYGYALGEDVQAAADWIQAGPRTWLAPDPAAVLQAVANDPYAIGYVPAHWVDPTVKRVKLEGIALGPVQQPVLVSAAAEPQGSQRSWLLCVQEKLR